MYGYNIMNLRKKPQPAPLPVQEDSPFGKSDEPTLIDRPNRRITQTAKYLINFMNEVNKEAREANKKKEKKIEQSIQKPEPIKRIKPQKPPTRVVMPPKVQKPMIEKKPVQNELHPSQSKYYNWNEDPFGGVNLFDPKRTSNPPGFPADFLTQPKRSMEGMPPYIPNFDYVALQNHLQNLQAMQSIHGMPKDSQIPGGISAGMTAIPGMRGVQRISGMPGIQGIQSMPAIQGLQGLQGIQSIQNIPGIGYVQVPHNNSQFYFNNNGATYIRVPMMQNTSSQIPQQMNMKVGNQKKMFKRASYHAAIAYYIHLEKLKKRSEVEQLDEAYFDPTYSARKMRQVSKSTNREVPKQDQVPMIEQQSPQT